MDIAAAPATDPAPVHPIRRVREARKLTLDEAAAELHTSKGNLSRVENGEHGMGPALLDRVLKWAPGEITANDLYEFRQQVVATEKAGAA